MLTGLQYHTRTSICLKDDKFLCSLKEAVMLHSKPLFVPNKGQLARVGWLVKVWSCFPAAGSLLVCLLGLFQPACAGCRHGCAL